MSSSIEGAPRRTIWPKDGDPSIIQAIDQRRLPFELAIYDIATLDDADRAIREMVVRGAPLIGITAAYGLYVAALEGPRDGRFREHMADAARRLRMARPTAVNLAWALDRAMASIADMSDPDACARRLFEEAEEMAREDAAWCRAIGEHGLALIEEIARRKDGPVNILTHCNAGWLACIEYGTATAPIYLAYEAGIRLHVWVDETRPRSQGARLTAWELAERGVPHTLVVDNAGGHLMQHGMVDIAIVGCDRATRNGDACNKIGTYLKALAARDNGVPFYVALPSSTFDWRIGDGVAEIPIEERSADEVRVVEGLVDGEIRAVTIVEERTPVANYGFDVTPARLVTGFITERGICGASEREIVKLYPEWSAVDAR